MRTGEKIRHKKFWIISSFVVTLILFLSGHALATPSLVIDATDIYLYSNGNGYPNQINDAWIYYIADEDEFRSGGESEGIWIGPSGTEVTIYTNLLNKTDQIYLVADISEDITGPTYGGQDFIHDDGSFINEASGYKNHPYWYIALSMDENDWQEDPDFPGGSDTYFKQSATFTYNGIWELGNYLFAAAETDGDPSCLKFKGVGKKDVFSPKTSSAGGLPEPSTVVLLGLGLIGLFGFGLKKIQK